MFQKYTKRTILALIISTLFLVSTVFAGQDIKIIFNGEELKLDVAPVVENDTTLVPLRHVFEAFGVSPEWDGANQTITAAKDDVVIWLQLNNKIAKIGDEEVELLAAPKAVDGRTLVPLRFISEAFGVSPVWDEATKTITINVDLSVPAEDEDVDTEVEDVDAEAEDVDAEVEDVDAEAEDVDAEAEDVDAEAEDVDAEAEDVDAEVEDADVEAEEISDAE